METKTPVAEMQELKTILNRYNIDSSRIVFLAKRGNKINDTITITHEIAGIKIAE